MTLVLPSSLDEVLLQIDDLHAEDLTVELHRGHHVFRQQDDVPDFVNIRPHVTPFTCTGSVTTHYQYKNVTCSHTRQERGP